MIATKKTLLILGFPGVGKTRLKEKMKSSDKVISDSDSSEFRYRGSFPDSYIESIREAAKHSDVVMVSTHKEVRDAIARDAMLNKMCEISIIYPSRELRDEYIKRFKSRGNSLEFINFVASNFTRWVDEIDSEELPFTKVKMSESGKYLSDVIEIHE